jgi:hypothetical protein
MISARTAMMTFGDYSIVDNENRSDRRIGAGLAECLFGLAQGSAHELFVSRGFHCFWRSIIVLTCRGNAALGDTCVAIELSAGPKSNLDRKPLRSHISSTRATGIT